MKLFRRGNKDTNPIIARMIPGEIPVTKYLLSEPKQITNSRLVGHMCLLYHGLDWVYLQELWTKQRMIIYLN